MIESDSSSLWLRGEVHTGHYKGNPAKRRVGYFVLTTFKRVHTHTYVLRPTT